MKLLFAPNCFTHKHNAMAHSVLRIKVINVFSVIYRTALKEISMHYHSYSIHVSIHWFTPLFSCSLIRAHSH